MQNKDFLKSLRIVMAVGSVGGFVGGWVLLAHSSKQADSESSTAGPALIEPLATPTAGDLITTTPTDALSVASPTATASSKAQSASSTAPTATASSEAQVTSTPTPTATTVKPTATQVTTAKKLRTGGS